MKNEAAAAFLPLFIIFCLSCGEDNGSSEDAAAEDTAPADQAGDTGADTSADTAPDTAPDTALDSTPDGEPDGETECAAAGGYCGGYAPIPPHCILCDSSATRYIPAPVDQGAMGCPLAGVGSSPWCCLPAGEPGSNDCETGGGDCYPAGPTDACPPGWERIRASCGDERLCCQPGGDCDGH